MDENFLIEEAKKGDLDAFNSLVLAYQTRVYNLAFRILGDEPAAEDSTQITFLVAFQKLAGFRGGSFIAWLLRIATNQCYDALRYDKRHPTTRLEPTSDEDDAQESPSWMADRSNQPEEIFDRVELDHAIQHCLSALPTEYRTVTILVDIQGMDYDTAAGIIKTPLGTIKSRLARARLRLRECLSGVWELLPASIRPNMEGNS
jgi:RNA polymerase sigma-70 factor (ECF subfamily)